MSRSSGRIASIKVLTLYHHVQKVSIEKYFYSNISSFWFSLGQQKCFTLKAGKFCITNKLTYKHLIIKGCESLSLMMDPDVFVALQLNSDVELCGCVYVRELNNLSAYQPNARQSRHEIMCVCMCVVSPLPEIRRWSYLRETLLRFKRTRDFQATFDALLEGEWTSEYFRDLGSHRQELLRQHVSIKTCCHAPETQKPQRCVYFLFLIFSLLISCFTLLMLFYII